MSNPHIPIVIHRPRISYESLLCAFLLALFVLTVYTPPAFAAVLASQTDSSTAYTPMWNTGSSGYWHLRFITGSTVIAKSVIVASSDVSCTNTGLAVVINGVGVVANSASSTATIDSDGRVACQWFFDGSGLSLSAGTYYFSGGVNSSSDGTWYGAASGSASETGNGNLSGSSFTAYGSGGERAYVICNTAACSFLPAADSTRIIATVPLNHAVVASSTSFAVNTTAAISSADYSSDLRVRIRVSNDARRITMLANALLAFDSAFGTGSTQHAVDKTFLFSPVNGTYVYATTTELAQIGQYTYQAFVEKPHDYFFGLNFGVYDTLAATTTKFLVATSTAYDALVTDNVSNFNALLNAETEKCIDIITTFKACIFSLIVPNDDDFNAVGQQIYDTFFTRVPFGYVTRFVSIMSSSTPIALPALSYSFGTSSPAVLVSLTASDPVTFNIFDNFGVIQSIRSDQPEHKNIWEIVDPYWQMAVAFCVLFVIMEDLLGMSFGVASDEIPEKGTLTKTQSIAARNKYLRDRDGV